MVSITELKAILLGVDPDLKKYFWPGTGEAYTVWTPHHISTEMSDDLPEQKITKVTIDRYSKQEADPVADQIMEALESRSISTEEPLTAFEADSGYFHHIIECYATR